MDPKFKLIAGVVILAVILLPVAGWMMQTGGTAKTGLATGNSSPRETKPAEPVQPSKPIIPPGLKAGMTYEEAAAILYEPGTPIDQPEKPGGGSESSSMKQYQWYAGTPREIILRFHDGKLDSGKAGKMMIGFPQK